MEGFENVIFHEAFYNKNKGVDVMKCVLEFDMTDPIQAVAHNNALKGAAYRKVLTMIEGELSDAIKEGVGSPEAEYLSKVVVRLHDLIVENDIKINRK